MTRQKDSDDRVVRAAEHMLADEGYVGVLDLFLAMHWLEQAHIQRWQRQQVPDLEGLMLSKRPKRLQALEVFEAWAQERDLPQVWAAFYPKSRWQDKELQVTVDGDEDLERRFRQVFLPEDADARSRKKVQAKVQEKPELVAYMVRRETECGWCGTELPKRSLILLEKEAAICLECAELDHLTFLGRGDATLTRRARSNSSLNVVIVEWARRRKRYERQGVLLEPWALEKAEQECCEDQDQRRIQREKAAQRRAKDDRTYCDQVFQRLTDMFPNGDSDYLRNIAEHTTLRGSGRAGRSAAAKQLDDDMLRLAVIAGIRHDMTNYDELLMLGWDRAEARREVNERVNEILAAWENKE